MFKVYDLDICYNIDHKLIYPYEEEHTHEHPTIYHITNSRRHICKDAGKSFKDNCTVPREDLRYLKVLHVGFDGKTHIGELVVNRLIADDVLDIFKQLYEAGYEIEKSDLLMNMMLMTRSR